MINKFAQMRDSWFTKIILIITALSFMSLFGVSGYINSAASNKAVIQVDNIQISQSEFSYMLQRELMKLRALTGDLGDNEEEADEIKAKVATYLANTKLNDAIIANTMLKNKIDFSDALVGQIISFMPEFNYNGQFSADVYHEYLKQSNKTESEFVDEVKRNFARKLLIEIPLADTKIPAIEQKQMEKVLGQRRTFKYFRINNADSIVSREPTQEELDQIYEDMAEELIIPEKRDVSIMYLSQEAIENSIEVTPEEITAYYKEHIDEFEQPEQRHVLQMVFEDEDTAKAVADELTSGANFATVAAANGQNPNDIDLGFVSKNDVSEELAEVIFSLTKNAISEPTQINDSWQIIKVLDVKAAEKKDPAESEKQIIAEIRQEKAYNGNYEILAAIEDKIGAGATLEDIATIYNAPIYAVKSLDESGQAEVADAAIKEVLSGRDLIDTVFSYNEGEVSQVVETDEGLAVALINKIYDAHQQPQEEATDKLHQMWVENERASLTQEKIDNIRQDSEAGDDLPTIAKRYQLSVISSRPIARGETLDDKVSLDQMVTLFSAVVGEPIVLETGDDYIVAATTDIYDDSAALTTQQKDQLQQVLQRGLLQEMGEALLKDFASQYKVKVEHGRMGLNN